MRTAVKGVLATVPGIETVCSISRSRREFQENEFPVAAVGIVENVDVRGRNAPGHRPAVRQMNVEVLLAVRASDDPEDVLDELMAVLGELVDVVVVVVVVAGSLYCVSRAGFRRSSCCSFGKNVGKTSTPLSCS